MNTLPTIPAPDPSGPSAPWRDWCLAQRQAKALTWSTPQFDTVATACLGHLYRDDRGVYRNLTPATAGGAGGWRRVHTRRVEALIAAGFLRGPAGGWGPVTATPDGIRAVAAWNAHQPAPRDRTSREEGETLPPLQEGEEQARRAREWAVKEAAYKKRRAAEWAAFEERRAATDAREANDAAYRQAAGITHPWAKAPEGWTAGDPVPGAKAPRVVERHESTERGHVTVYESYDDEDQADEQPPTPTRPALQPSTVTGCAHPAPRVRQHARPRATTPRAGSTRPARPTPTRDHYPKPAPKAPRTGWGSSTPGRTGIAPRRPAARPCLPLPAPQTREPLPPAWTSDTLDAA
ncbi:hypothetical protein ACIPRL_07915 [Streptomyces sp. NPDC090085]|uniref:hypothetical protein n=1 Tax=Streptomyces sp. NPDC090085 TaxID=3365943 RepID=UPI00380F9540